MVGKAESQASINARTEGKKLDAGKSPLLQGVLAYFPNALAAVGMVSEYGAHKYHLKYEDKNWSRVDGGLGRYGDALARHTTRHAAGESHDPESHLLHVAHAAWNALAVLELVLKEQQLIEPVPEVSLEASHLETMCIPGFNVDALQKLRKRAGY